MNNTITDKTIATEIFNQLGGKSFIAMTGARNFCCDSNSLGFMLSSTMTKDRINFIKITLNVMDTYDIEFKNLRAGVIKEVSHIEGVYNDMLKSIIEDKTGLRLSL